MTSPASGSRCAACWRTRVILARAVENGEACLDELAKETCELIFLDVWLPGQDGMETLARIQEMPATDRPVVVMISGHGNIETAVSATKLGAFDFLEKPLSIQKVSVVAKNALEHRRLQLENTRLREGDTSRNTASSARACP